MRKVIAIGWLFALTACFKPSNASPRVWKPTTYDDCRTDISKAPPYPIGVTFNRTDLPYGRYDGLMSMRAHVLTDQDDMLKITANFNISFLQQFNGWAPLGPLLTTIWEDPQHAMREESEQNISMSAQWYKADNYVWTKDHATKLPGVSYYNAAAIYDSDGSYSFGAMIGNQQKPYLITNGKTSQASNAKEFAYGYRMSYDGKKYAYHDGYKLTLGDAATHREQVVQGPGPFNFGPVWSYDSSSVAYLCGVQKSPNICLANSDGTDAKQVGSRGGYDGVVPFITSFDFHGGGSDVFVWSHEGVLFYTALDEGSVEIFSYDTKSEQTKKLTHSPVGVWNNFPDISSDDKYLVYTSTFSGRRDVWYMDLNNLYQYQLTVLPQGCAARYPKWRPND